MKGVYILLQRFNDTTSTAYGDFTNTVYSLKEDDETSLCVNELL